MTEEEFLEVEKLGANYCDTLTKTLDAIPVEAQVHMVRIIFNSVMVQMCNRRGPEDTVAFLRRMAQRIELDAESRRIVQ